MYVGRAFRGRAVFFGEALDEDDDLGLIAEDDERERVTRLVRLIMAFEDDADAALLDLSILSLMGSAVAVRLRFLFTCNPSMLLGETSLLTCDSTASAPVFDGLVLSSVVAPAALPPRRNRFSLPWKLVIRSTEVSSKMGDSGLCPRGFGCAFILMSGRDMVFCPVCWVCEAQDWTVGLRSDG